MFDDGLIHGSYSLSNLPRLAPREAKIDNFIPWAEGTTIDCGSEIERNPLNYT